MGEQRVRERVVVAGGYFFCIIYFFSNAGLIKFIYIIGKAASLLRVPFQVMEIVLLCASG
jgi:hypothetical protein